LLTAKSAREHIKIWGTNITSEICGRKSSGNLKNIMVTMGDLLGYRRDLRGFGSAETHRKLGGNPANSHGNHEILRLPETLRQQTRW